MRLRPELPPRVCAWAAVFVATVLVASCDSGLPRTAPASPSPTPSSTVFLTLAEGVEPKELTATEGHLLTIVLDEPKPKEQRWVLIYTPPFLSATEARYFPDASDGRPRSEFDFLASRRGKGAVEFGKITVGSTRDPSDIRAVMVRVEPALSGGSAAEVAGKGPG